MRDYDVVVVGAGGAGLMAAVCAAEDCKRVLLLESADRPGGSTALSGGVLYAAGTSVQRSAGVEDSAEAMFNYYMILNQYKINPGLVRTLCDESARTVEQLIAMGVSFPIENLYAAGLDGVKRGHRAEGRGAAIIEALEGRASKLGNLDVVCSSQVTALQSDAISITGVVVGASVVLAPAVILTSGGFGASREMIDTYLPSTAKYGDALWYVGSPHCRGDGINMAARVGADIVGIDSVTPLLTPGFGKDFEPYIPGWFMFVSHAGRRFANETVDYSVSGRLVRELPDGECFAIFDETARIQKQVKREKGGQQFMAPSWAPDRLLEMAESGRIARAATLGGLATECGINAENLATTVAEFNRDCERGVDQQFFKPPELLRPILTPPFYSVRIQPSAIGITGAGLLTDRHARVLATTGAPIKGLFAAGETVGGVMGECYVGGGGSLLNSFALGRVSAASAKHYLDDLKQTTR